MSASSTLPWNFEAFRSFISFEVLQQAASVIVLFEGKDIFNNGYLMQKFEEEMSIRTGVEWLPKRNIDSGINFNVEGNLFRNKARVLTSFFLVELQSLINKSPLKATDFCKALGSGLIDKRNFYVEVISRFSYPHPAYEDNWERWNTYGITLRPFIFMLDILLKLHDQSSSEAYFSVSEFAQFAHGVPDHEKTKEIASQILNNRSNAESATRTRSDDVDRKIGDLFGFLCMTGFTYYHGKNVYLNLVDVHPEEKVYFMEKRGEINSKKNIQIIVENGKPRK